MKHIKNYKLFESNSIQDIISNIKDMLLEIEDLGNVNTDCREFKPFNYNKTKASGKTVVDSEIRLWIRPKDADYNDDEFDPNNAFEINDTVIDVYERIIDYMTSQGWAEYQVIYDDGYENKKMNLDEIDRMDIWPSETFGITFKKSEDESTNLKTPQGWEERKESGFSHFRSSLIKDFEFESFRDAQKFVNKVADLSESQNHHPRIEWDYDKVQISLSTHDAGDIVTIKDVKLANSINEIYGKN